MRLEDPELEPIVVDDQDPAHFLAVPAERSATLRASSGAIAARLARPSRMTFTSALPTTTPSACAATCDTCCRVDIPNPTAIGRPEWARMRATASGMPPATWSRTPVTPTRDT